MSGFIQPQWSGFSQPAPAEADEARRKAEREAKPGAPVQPAGAPPGAGGRLETTDAARPPLVTPASPRPHKPMIP